MKARTLEEARAELMQIIHDCPDCQAARARGEEPVIIDFPVPRRMSMRERFQRTRWRERKRRR